MNRQAYQANKEFVINRNHESGIVIFSIATILLSILIFASEQYAENCRVLWQ